MKGDGAEARGACDGVAEVEEVAGARDSPGVLHLPGRPEVNLAQETLERVRVPRRRGRPRKRPERLVADEAYDCDRFRGWLQPAIRGRPWCMKVSAP